MSSVLKVYPSPPPPDPFATPTPATSGRRSFDKRSPMAGGPVISRSTKPTRLNGNCLGPSPVAAAVPHDHAGPPRDGFSETAHWPSAIGGCPRQVRASLAREAGLSEGRLRGWISYMIMAGALERAAASGQPRFTVKGGIALELRLRNRARATKDIDVVL